MTPIERQILKNQKVILRYLWLKDNNFTSGDGTLLIKTANETDELLNPKKSNEPACEMSEDANVSNSEKGCGKKIFANDEIKCGEWSGGDQHFCAKCFAIQKEEVQK